MSKWVHLPDLLGEIGNRGVRQYHHQAAVHSGASARRSGWTGIEPTQKVMALSFHLGSLENKKSGIWWLLGTTSPPTAESMHRC